MTLIIRTYMSSDWDKSFLEHDAAVAVEKDRIVGFGDMDQTGYLDRLYVHKDCQRQGIATAICDELEQRVNAHEITTYASITAKPFFEGSGYVIIKEQKVVRAGIPLKNYAMKKIVDTVT